MSFWRRMLRGGRAENEVDGLYRAIVAAGRDPVWYREGGVPDTVDGRFDMIAAVLALVLLRFEEDGEPSRAASVLLAENFIDDMEGNIRQLGTGDLVVGKSLTKMMGALGGRLAAFREASAEGDWLDPVRRNVFREKPPSDAAVGFVGDRLARFRTCLDAAPSDALIAGSLPAL